MIFRPQLRSIADKAARLLRRAGSSTSRVEQPGCCARDRRGATTVEFAVVVPVFFFFILGMVEIGRGMMVIHLLSNAARDGCRQAILSGKTTSDVTTKVNSLLSKQGITGATTEVKVNGGTADASSAASSDEITVSVSVAVSSITWVPGAQYLKSGNLKGTYSLRRE